MTNVRWCILFALVFVVCYGGAAWWTSTLPGPLPSWDFAFEQHVPFVPGLSIIYITITPVLLLAPFLLRERTPMFALALSVETIIATFFFVLFPQTNAWVRPEVTGWARVPFGIADTMNLAWNEFPSLHVAFAVSAAWAYRRFAWTVWAAAVAVSAWLMWEHHLVEIAAGVALGMIVMRVAERESTWVELCCLAQCARFSRRHIRYFVIFLAIYGPSLLHWRRYRAVRTGFCAAQWIDDLLDGDRPSDREPLEIVGELLEEMMRLASGAHGKRRAQARQPMWPRATRGGRGFGQNGGREGGRSNTHRWSGRLRGRVDALDLTTPRKARGYIGRRAFARPRWRPYRFQMAKLQTPRKARGHIVKRATARHEDPLSRLTRAFFAEITPDAQRDFVALVRCMRIDRVRVLGREAWTSTQLDEHHRRTFTLSVNLLLTTAGCTARAEQVPSLIEALAWCSVFRDLDDDQRKGLNNIPRGLDAEQWARASYTRARLSIERAAAEIAALQEPRARRILGIFQRSIAKFGERAGADAAVRESEEDPFPRRT